MARLGPSSRSMTCHLGQMLCFTMGYMLICVVRVSVVVRKSRFLSPLYRTREVRQVSKAGDRRCSVGLMCVGTQGEAGACGWARSASICISKHRRPAEGAPAPRFMAWLAAAAGTGHGTGKARRARRPRMRQVIRLMGMNLMRRSCVAEPWRSYPEGQTCGRSWAPRKLRELSSPWRRPLRSPSRSPSALYRSR